MATTAIALALCAGPVALPAGGSGTTVAAQEPPNIVVLMSDDQTVESMRVMRRARRIIGDRGATFQNSFVNFPLCCPSRATFLTGQYAHNHGVTDNRPPRGGYAALDHSETLPVWLRDAGYYTAHIGKYMNGYESQPQPETIPPGWSEWHGSTSKASFYGYQLNEDGALFDYGLRPAAYQTDVLTDEAVELIRERAASRQPFFLLLSYLAPHGGGPNPNPNPPRNCGGSAKPASRHAHAFDFARLPRPGSFNEADVSDKPNGIRSRPRLDARDGRTIQRTYRCRLESLLAIDEGIQEVIGTLRSAGELATTYLIFTSDNGFLHGEHRIPKGKGRVYEEAIRVPLLIRGPEIPPGIRVRELVINADLAPTILDAAGAEPGHALDGLSLLEALRDRSPLSERDLLIETGKSAAIRTPRFIYVEHRSGEREMYDLSSDPLELESVHHDPTYSVTRALLALRLAALQDCSGASCRMQSTPP